MSERLQKVLAALGHGSRREIERWIRAGRVRVDGEIAELGVRVTADSDVALDGKKIRLEKRLFAPQTPRLLIYHKPVGEISSRTDARGRPTVFDRLPPLARERWVSIGRLDINTSGLLLFTNDGQLANRLMHPSAGLDREYQCRIIGAVSRDAIANLTRGVALDGKLCRFLSVCAHRQRSDAANRWYTVIVQEGRYREVRRLWEAVGCRVSRLKRTRYGAIKLPRHLKPGQFLEVEPNRVSQLLASLGKDKRIPGERA